MAKVPSTFSFLAYFLLAFLASANGGREIPLDSEDGNIYNSKDFSIKDFPWFGKGFPWMGKGLPGKDFPGKGFPGGDCPKFPFFPHGSGGWPNEGDGSKEGDGKDKFHFPAKEGFKHWHKVKLYKHKHAKGGHEEEEGPKDSYNFPPRDEVKLKPEEGQGDDHGKEDTKEEGPKIPDNFSPRDEIKPKLPEEGRGDQGKKDPKPGNKGPKVDDIKAIGYGYGYQEVP